MDGDVLKSYMARWEDTKWQEFCHMADMHAWIHAPKREFRWRFDLFAVTVPIRWI